MENGEPLKNWDIKINFGIKTGFNDAFIITREKRQELIDSDPKSAEIIRPILRGRDIKRYGYNFADLWLINTHNGIKEKAVERIDVNNYPAIKAHLEKFHSELFKRADQGDTPYNLRNCVYMDDFSKPKIVWARLSRISKEDFSDFPRFCLVKENIVVLDSLCFFVGENLESLIKVLNSKFASYYFFNSVAILDNGGLQMRQQFVENIPIPKIDLSNKTDQYEIDKLIFSAFGLTDDEIKYIDDYLASKQRDIQG